MCSHDCTVDLVPVDLERIKIGCGENINLDSFDDKSSSIKPISTANFVAKINRNQV